MTMKIPDAALQQHLAVLGKTGSGKTFAMKGIIEHLLELGRRVSIVDPTGAWWGLRSSRDGKGAGFPILVLGGDHGDLPLPSLGGAAVARLITEQGVNLVADTSLLSVGERTRWFLEFAGTLYRTNRAPLHLVLDEAHNFAPQGGGQARDIDTGKMLHAANTLASGGRSRGIRLAMITQRPQKLHKDALTSADTLIAMRVLAPQDRAAVEDWIKGCGDIAQGKEVLNSLASLARGEGWCWYPEGGFLQRMTFPPIKTFDSSATPTDGHAVEAPRGAAEVDLGEIKAALADAVKQAEENDPKQLRARIADLQKQVINGSPSAEPDPALIEEAEMRGHALGHEAGYSAAMRAIQPITDRLETLAAAVNETISGFREDLQRIVFKAPSGDYPRTTQVTRLETGPTPRATVKCRSIDIQTAPSGSLPKGETVVLTAIAQHREGVTREQLTVLTGYKRSTRDAYIQRLRERALIEDGTIIRATAAGAATLGSSFKPLPTGRALLEHWMQRLPEGERRVLDIVVRGWPDRVDREVISKETGYARSSRDAYLQRLGARQLVITERGNVRASDTLFASRR
jgi:hypothetical protein